ncbi:uncharacterized protein Dana_GF10551 [Drosophila ananassae]|uniref:MADF domain-containing protein n=1 Tax=Drosophila ananassae TaxID=7217 RepID=B3M4U6_DROAN|nr:uncharacterized protein LOC123257104 [Drosophila ananassae]EDV40520.2 uncharacterized protein Dana_GF10551 [Drosophila ananassae]
MEQKHRRCCFKRSGLNFTVPCSQFTESSGIRDRQVTDAVGVAVASSISKAKEKHHKSWSPILSFFGRKKSKKMDPLRGSPLEMEEQDVRKLIRLYRKHDNLYNPKNSYYGNKEIDEDCYNAMVPSFPGQTSTGLRSRVEELRSLFEREYTIMESAHRKYGEIMTPSIRYYNEFLFLVPYLCINFDKEWSQSSSQVTNPNSKLSVKDIQNRVVNNMASMTGCPLTPFPNHVSYICKKGKKKKTKDKDKDKDKDESLNADEDSETRTHTSVTFASSPDLCPCDVESQSEKDAPPKTNNEKSKMSVQSSYYSNELDLKTTDLTCARRPDNSPCLPECRVVIAEPPPPCTKIPNPAAVPEGTEGRSSSTGAASIRRCSQPNGPVPPIPPSCLAQNVNNQQVLSSTTPTGNGQQVQMLCEMIRMELTTAPDFIYFDAKWRIIEILREVHKRQLVLKKATPLNQAQKISCLNENYLLGQKPGKRPPCKVEKGGCPYCMRNAN